jgi:hypothetical protein
MPIRQYVSRMRKSSKGWRRIETLPVWIDACLLQLCILNLLNANAGEVLHLKNSVARHRMFFDIGQSYEYPRKLVKLDTRLPCASYKLSHLDRVLAAWCGFDT